VAKGTGIRGRGGRPVGRNGGTRTDERGKTRKEKQGTRRVGRADRFRPLSREPLQVEVDRSPKGERGRRPESPGKKNHAGPRAKDPDDRQQPGRQMSSERRERRTETEGDNNTHHYAGSDRPGQ